MAPGASSLARVSPATLEHEEASAEHLSIAMDAFVIKQARLSEQGEDARDWHTQQS